MEISLLVRGYHNISRNNWCKYNFVTHGSLIDFLYMCFIKSTWNGCCSGSTDSKFTMKFQHMMHKSRYIKHFSGAIGPSSSSPGLIWYNLPHSSESPACTNLAVQGGFAFVQIPLKVLLHCFADATGCEYKLGSASLFKNSHIDNNCQIINSIIWFGSHCI